jgi:uncharacterized protein
MDDAVLGSGEKVNWGQVGLFLALTFGLTWLLNWVLWRVGFGTPSMLVLLQLQMLLPASSAILLGMFVFTNSPIYFRDLAPRVAAFLIFFLILALVYVGLAVGVSNDPGQLQVYSGAGTGLAVLGLLFALLLRFIGGRDAFARAGLRWGRPRYWLLGGVGFVLFYVIQILLNGLFGLGHAPDTESLASLATRAGMTTQTLMVVGFVQSVVVSPFLAILIAFGEEYGWRGYLQSELVKLGKVRGILLLGVIWGMWHAPIIAMGYNYPGYPVVGPILMTGYTVGLAFPLAYAVFKSGSVWLAAYLHALNNQVLSTLAMLVNTPNDPVFSFGIGIYGLASIAIVDLLILRDPIWRAPVQSPARSVA